MRLVRLVLMTALAASIVGLAGRPAAAGGSSWFDSALDRYEAGQTVTMVGYTGGGQLGWIDDGPFFGYLRVDPAASDQYLKAEGGELSPLLTPTDLPLGPLTLQLTGRGGYLSLRAAITFTLPAQLAPGSYGFLYCNDPCTTGLGDLIGGSVWVGADPHYPVARDWPSDDPALDGASASVPLPAPPPTTTAPLTTAPSTSPPTSPAPTTPASAAQDRTPLAVRTTSAAEEDGAFPWVLAIGSLVIIAIGVSAFVRRPRPGPRIVRSPSDLPREPSLAVRSEPVEAGAARER